MQIAATDIADRVACPLRARSVELPPLSFALVVRLRDGTASESPFFIEKINSAPLYATGL